MDPALYIAAESGYNDVLMQNKDKIGVEVTPNHNTVLHIASQFGNKECVSGILSIHPSLLLQVNSRGESALHPAAKHGHYDIVVALVNYAASSLDASEDSQLEGGGVGVVKEMLMRMTNEDGDTALHEAVRYNHIDVVKFLIQQDSDFTYTANIAGETPLYIAARRGYDDLVGVILETCASPPAYGGPDGSTALHGAVISKSIDCTRKLVDWNKSLVKETDEKGCSPLHYDALFGSTFADYSSAHILCQLDVHNSIASQLLEADSSVVYLVDNDKNTALHIAVSKDNYFVAFYLIVRCPDCREMVNGKKQNILHIALEHESGNTVRFFLYFFKGTCNDLVTQKDVDGNTPLHLMAATNHKLLVLIHHFMADKAALNKQNCTPLDMVPKEHSDLWRALSKAGSTSSLQKVMSSRQGEIKRATEERDLVAQEREILAEMRKKSDINMIVAALIATVTFTAGFTMPGGYNQSGTQNPVPGMAVLSQKSAFQAFMVSDAIALLLSCVAIFLNFWGTFFYNLETVNKFVLATMLLVTAAIGALMIAFSTATYVVLAQSSALAIATCLVGVVSIPVSFVLCFRLGPWN